jgi:predicted dehydrogenase
MSTVRPLRCALLGGGGMGVRNAVNAEGTGHVTVTAVVTRRAGGASATEHALGHPVTEYTDFGRMIAAEHPEVVIVAIPPYAHAGEVETAAAAGAHLFLEKPIALDLERGRSQVEAVSRAGVVSYVDFHLRLLPVVRRIRESVVDGSAGAPVLFHASYLCNSLHTPWWRDAKQSGGQSVEQVIHLFDVARHLFGELQPHSAVRDTLCHADDPTYTSEDLAATILRGASGATVTISSTNCAVEQTWRTRFSAVYSEMTGEYDSAFPERAAVTPRSGAGGGNRGEPDPHVHAMREFISCVRTGRPSPVPIEEGLQSLELVLAAGRLAGE